MMTLRKAGDRFHSEIGWLDSWHTFSFSDHYDPRHMGFRALRVINDDRIEAGQGFGTHGHRDMEIVSYVLDGALAHQDSLGNGTAAGATGVIRPGDVQRMSAGTGVRHSEFNHSKDAATHFLQIWILPDRAGVQPGYEQVHVGEEKKRGQLALVAAPAGEGAAVTINASARIRAGFFDGEERAELTLDPKRLGYVHVARGSVRVNGEDLQAGDALKLKNEERLVIENGKQAEVLVFDLQA